MLNFFKAIVRRLYALAPKLKLVPPPTQRPNGISVMFRVFNEKTWIEASLSSIKDFADEILIGDTGSTDGTLEIIQTFIENHPNLNIQLLDCRNLSFIEENNFLLHKTRYRWVMRWDGDQIAHTEGKNSILKLRKYLMALDSSQYFGIILSYPHLFLDPFHLHKSLIGREMWVHTYQKDICYYGDKSRVFELLWIPPYFQIRELTNYFVFHCNIKSKERSLDRSYWRQWDKLDHKAYPTLKDVALINIQKDFKTNDYSTACNENLKRSFNDVVKYSSELVGDYPKLLEPFLSNPPYRLIYDDNGKIIKRSDF
jgi:glycosyltransferase involved in cell wall biosynthesis